MKDLKNKFPKFTISKKLKIILLVSTAAGTIIAAPILYFSLKSKPKVVTEISQAEKIGDVEGFNLGGIEQQESENGFAMNEEYFGKKEEQLPEFDPSPSPPKEKPKIKAEGIFTEHESARPAQQLVANNNKTKSQNFETQTEIISYESPEDNKGKVLELLTDKDYPRSIASKPYDLSRVLTTDMFIPAVMYTAVNSEIPSKTVTAIVESDVSGFHGRNILIPKGSKVEGVYEKLENKHARRMQISWFKITRPDGVIIKLDSESADSHGASGVTGYLDQRLKDRYGGALLLSSINALAQLSVSSNDVRQLAAVESFGREFGTLTATIIRENMNAMPIIMIKQGQRFNIRPYQNIYFDEVKNSNINALFL